MTIRRLLAALTTTALLTGAMLGAPKATVAVSAYNSISWEENRVFMQNLNGLAVGDRFLSAFDNSIHTVVAITAGSLDCGGSCDGFYLAEGTSGWNLTYDGDEIYGTYTEDTLTETELLNGLNVTVWNFNDMGGDFYLSWAPWNTGVPEANIASICTDSAHVEQVDGIGFLADNGCQLESDYSEDDNGYGDVAALFTGFITAPASGSVEFCAYTDDGFHLEIDGTTVINTWELQGPGNCNGVGSFTFVAGVAYSIELWWFENGGGEDIAMKYNTEGGYVPVPASWFTRPATSGANCGDLDAAVCPTITDAGTNRVTGAPGSDYTTARATYTWLRCRDAGDAFESRRAPTGCRVIRSTRSTAARMENSPYRISSGDRGWGYLRLAVSVGRTTYYSGAYDLNQ
jgi:hypothetical protein